VGKESEYTLLKRRHTNDQERYAKIARITNLKEIKIKTTMRYDLTHVE
jgi:hypothetical protein